VDGFREASCDASYKLPEDCCGQMRKMCLRQASPAKKYADWSTNIIYAWMGFKAFYSHATLGSISLGSAVENQNVCTRTIHFCQRNIAVR